ncbi:hypothetical protein EXIGLDRAFT_728856 [Exidia glandulosa HHB12029]|uniref:LITAF domain-containing protein n=1 Tax=Exidia glandulosa HHB12029 TaxID=1314781 RepID=A0A165CTP5_EXIGL|nr:hypothetical protein EXIGLDRAFT_728856 [Exidia glandulosa HHB12029]
MNATDDLPRYEPQSYTPHPFLPGKLQAELRRDSQHETMAESGPSTAATRSPVLLSTIAAPPRVVESGSVPLAPRPILRLEIPGSPLISRPVVPVPPGQMHSAVSGIPTIIIQPHAYRLPQPQNLGKTAAEVQCPYCNSCQKTRTETRSGDYTMMMSIVMGVFTCLWCVPYAFDVCKDVEHSCSNCDRPVARWHRHGGKVDVPLGDGRGLQ